jgi:poly(3-hydroxybutyrate) depolymerase
MLYSLYEAQHAALVPLRFLAELTRGWFGHPFSPFAHHPLSRPVRRVERSFPARDRSLRKAAVESGEAESSRARKPFCNLIRFRLGAPSRARCSSWRRFRATTPRWCAIRSRAAREHDVLVTDWSRCRMVPLTAGPFHLDDYVDYVREWITLLSPDST